MNLLEENAYLRKENRRLRKLCRQKDSFFKELISDALRHGNKLAAQHMSDRKKFIHGNNKKGELYGYQKNTKRLHCRDF